MPELSANELYHYTNKIENLINIIKNGFEHRLLQEDLPLTGFSNDVYSIPGIVRHVIQAFAVCFCDIPFSLVGDHVNEYGKHCIGLKKEWGMQKGITPIRYIHFDTPEVRDDTFYTIKNTLKNLNQFNGSFSNLIIQIMKTYNQKNISQDELNELPDKINFLLQKIDVEMLEILKFNTRYYGLLRSYEGDWQNRVDGQQVTKRFYDEREWRAIKTDPNQSNLYFTAEDIVVILIEQESDKPILLEAIEEAKEKLNITSSNELEVKIKLTSEVVNI